MLKLRLMKNSSGGQEDQETLSSIFRFFLCTTLYNFTFLKDFIYLFDRERERESQREHELGDKQMARKRKAPHEQGA